MILDITMQENSQNKETEKIIPEGKKKFENRIYMNPSGVLKQGIYIDNELLDWSIDVGDLLEAKKMGPEYVEMLKMDIVRHFVESCSDFLGRKVTPKEIDDARKNGYI